MKKEKVTIFITVIASLSAGLIWLLLLESRPSQKPSIPCIYISKQSLLSELPFLLPSATADEVVNNFMAWIRLPQNDETTSRYFVTSKFIFDGACRYVTPTDEQVIVLAFRLRVFCYDVIHQTPVLRESIKIVAANIEDGQHKIPMEAIIAAFKKAGIVAGCRIYEQIPLITNVLSAKADHITLRYFGMMEEGRKIKLCSDKKGFAHAKVVSVAPPDYIAIDVEMASTNWKLSARETVKIMFADQNTPYRNIDGTVWATPTEIESISALIGTGKSTREEKIQVVIDAKTCTWNQIVETDKSPAKHAKPAIAVSIPTEQAPVIAAKLPAKPSISLPVPIVQAPVIAAKLPAKLSISLPVPIVQKVQSVHTIFAVDCSAVSKAALRNIIASALDTEDWLDDGGLAIHGENFSIGMVTAGKKTALKLSGGTQKPLSFGDWLRKIKALPPCTVTKIRPEQSHFPVYYVLYHAR